MRAAGPGTAVISITSNIGAAPGIVAVTVTGRIAVELAVISPSESTRPSKRAEPPRRYRTVTPETTLPCASRASVRRRIVSPATIVRLAGVITSRAIFGAGCAEPASSGVASASTSEARVMEGFIGRRLGGRASGRLERSQSANYGS